MPQPPLAGRRVAVLRPRRQNEELIAGLVSAGAQPLECPVIDIVPPLTWAPLDTALAAAAARRPRYDWIMFTSVNAVEAVADRLTASQLDLPDDMQLAAIGPATSAQLERRLRPPALVANRYESSALADAFATAAGQRVLLPCSDLADQELPCALRARGMEIDVVTAYRTIPIPTASQALVDCLQRGEADALVFTSGSTVRALVAGTEPPAIAAIFLRACPPATFCIGPRTAMAARGAGLPVSAVASPHTTAGLLSALVSWFQTNA
jgi:uroporphyrinogen-III synthase